MLSTIPASPKYIYIYIDLPPYIWTCVPSKRLIEAMIISHYVGQHKGNIEHMDVAKASNGGRIRLIETDRLRGLIRRLSSARINRII